MKSIDNAQRTSLFVPFPAKVGNRNMVKNARASAHKALNFDILRRALRVPEAAAALGISRSSIYSLIRSGRIGYVRISGGSIRVPASEIDRFIDSNVVQSGK